MPEQSLLPPRQYVSKGWIAQRFDMSERSIDRLIAAKVLTAYKIGRLVRLDAAEVEQALTSQHVVPLSEIEAATKASLHEESVAARNNALDTVLRDLIKTVPLSDEARRRIAELLGGGDGDAH